MADLKFQLVKDRTNPAKFDWDQREADGQFRGSEEGMDVKTFAEVRISDEIEDQLTNPERLHEFIRPGDCVMDIVNRLADFAKPRDPGGIGDLIPWNRAGALIYGND